MRLRRIFHSSSPPKIPLKYADAAWNVRTISEAVLITLCAVGVLTTAVVAPNAVQVFGKIPFFRKLLDKPTRHQIPRSLNSLIIRRLVRKNREGYYEITEKGRKYVDRLMLRGLPWVHPRLWDRKWRMLIFDVPEGVRIRRDTLRNYLIQLGFVPLQQSVWIYPFPCEMAMDILRRELKLGRGRVRYITAEPFEGDEEYRSRFRLPMK